MYILVVVQVLSATFLPKLFSQNLLQTMPNVLSPHEISLDGWNWMSRLNRKRMLDIGGAPDPEDHPIVLEIRRRLVGMVLESAELNLF
jgi:hypothetical protein